MANNKSVADEYKSYISSWSMTKKSGKIYKKISIKIFGGFDYLKDIKSCGVHLGKYVKSVDRNVSTSSESTKYIALKEMFNDVNINDNTRFIDIGCGKGRILAEMERIKFPGQLYGIELNPDVAKYAQVRSCVQKKFARL